jgi:hypothetical protein
MRSDEYDYCKVLAADIAGIIDEDGDGVDDDNFAGDGVVNNVDATALNAVVIRFNILDQTSGKLS